MSTLYTPDIDQAEGLFFTGTPGQDPENYTATNPVRCDNKFFIYKIQNELLALNFKVYNNLPVEVYNNSGFMAKGALVYPSGYNTGSSQIEITASDPSDPSKPAVWVLADNSTFMESTVAYPVKTVDGQDTSGNSVGDPVYLDSASTPYWSVTAPTGANEVSQHVGVITVVDGSDGEILFYPVYGLKEQIGLDWFQDGSVDEDKLAASVAGEGLLGGVGTPLALDIDSLSEETSPAPGDMLVMYDPVADDHKKLDWDLFHDPLNEIVVNSISDLPTPSDEADGLGTCYHLDDKVYVIGADLTIAYDLVPEDETTFLAKNPVTITYTGAQAIVSANAGSNRFRSSRIDYICTNAAAKFVDVGGMARLALNLTSFSGGVIGDIDSNDAVIFTECTFQNFTGRLDITDCGILYATALTLLTSSPISDAYIGINGTSLSVVINDTQAIPQTGDYLFDIDSAFSGRVLFNTVNVITSAGGGAFISGSLDQTDPDTRVHVCPNIPDSRVSGGIYMRGNSTQTTLTTQGITQPFTAVSDGGGGEITLVMASTTGISATDTVWLPNSEYAGMYTVQSVIVNTSINLTATFGATASGEVHKGWVKIAGTTIADSHNERCHMPAANELEFDNLEEVVKKSACDFSFRTTSASPSTVETCLMKNDEDIFDMSIKSHVLTNVNVMGMVSGFENVVDGDKISLYGRNMTDASRHLIYANTALSVT